MENTRFVGHKPGTFSVYYGLAQTINKIGWYVAFLDEQGNISHPDGLTVYPYRQSAYRRCKQLNNALAQK